MEDNTWNYDSKSDVSSESKPFSPTASEPISEPFSPCENDRALEAQPASLESSCSGNGSNSSSTNSNSSDTSEGYTRVKSHKNIGENREIEQESNPAIEESTGELYRQKECVFDNNKKKVDNIGTSFHSDENKPNTSELSCHITVTPVTSENTDIGHPTKAHSMVTHEKLGMGQSDLNDLGPTHPMSLSDNDPEVTDKQVASIILHRKSKPRNGLGRRRKFCKLPRPSRLMRLTIYRKSKVIDCDILMPTTSADYTNELSGVEWNSAIKSMSPLHEWLMKRQPFTLRDDSDVTREDRADVLCPISSSLRGHVSIANDRDNSRSELHGHDDPPGHIPRDWTPNSKQDTKVKHENHSISCPVNLTVKNEIPKSIETFKPRDIICPNSPVRQGSDGQIVPLNLSKSRESNDHNHSPRIEVHGGPCNVSIQSPNVEIVLPISDPEKRVSRALDLDDLPPPLLTINYCFNSKDDSNEIGYAPNDKVHGPRRISANLYPSHREIPNERFKQITNTHRAPECLPRNFNQDVRVFSDQNPVNHHLYNKIYAQTNSVHVNHSVPDFARSGLGMGVRPSFRRFSEGAIPFRGRPNPIIDQALPFYQSSLQQSAAAPSCFETITKESNEHHLHEHNHPNHNVEPFRENHIRIDPHQDQRLRTMYTPTKAPIQHRPHRVSPPHVEPVQNVTFHRQHSLPDFAQDTEKHLDGHTMHDLQTSRKNDPETRKSSQEISRNDPSTTKNVQGSNNERTATSSPPRLSDGMSRMSLSVPFRKRIFTIEAEDTGPSSKFKRVHDIPERVQDIPERVQDIPERVQDIPERVQDIPEVNDRRMDANDINKLQTTSVTTNVDQGLHDAGDSSLFSPPRRSSYRGESTQAVLSDEGRQRQPPPQPPYMHCGPQTAAPRPPRAPEAASSIAIYCMNCDQKATFACSGCHRVAYCTRQCQRAAWKLHKSKCITSGSSSSPSGPQL